MVEKITNMKIRILGLYRSNYLAKYHVREMAKLLKKNHATILPHLAAFEKEKILLAEKSGRNKNFLLNLQNTTTKQYMIIAEKAETIQYLDHVFLIKKMMKELENIPLMGSITLFGSYAKNTYNEESDVDIFYIGEENETIMKEVKEIGKQYRKVINIKKATPNAFEKALREKDPLVIEIIKNHILLMNGEYFINALWRYYNEIRQ